VPKFIQMEPKIVGPLTFRQFLFFAVSTIVAVVIYFMVTFNVFIVSSIILIIGAAAFSYLKIEGKDLQSFVINIFKFLIGSKTFIWKKGGVRIKKTKAKIDPIEETKKPPIKTSRKSLIKDLQTFVETKKTDI